MIVVAFVFVVGILVGAAGAWVVARRRIADAYALYGRIVDDAADWWSERVQV